VNTATTLDYGELKVLSDLVAYLLRMCEAYNLGDASRKVIGKLSGVNPESLAKVKVTPPGGVNYQAIASAYCYLQGTQPEITVETAGLGLLEQQRLKKEQLLQRGMEGFVRQAVQELTELFQRLDPLEIQVRRRCKLLEDEILSEDENVGKALSELRALWDARLKLQIPMDLANPFDPKVLQSKAKSTLATGTLSSDERKFWQRIQRWAKFLESLSPEEKTRVVANLKQSLEKPLLDELERFIGEHLDVNSIRFPPVESAAENTCNFCGRACSGIRISEKMTLVDTPTTYYSGYNMLTSTDVAPRRLCSFCFFEGVLRKVLYPTQGKGLFVFVFPEYVFTPYHARIFAKQIQEAFPEALEDEAEADVEESSTRPEFEELLKAIQFKLGVAPKEFTEDVLLPVFVVPMGGGDDLKTWIDKLHRLLQLWDGIGLKYILTANFYSEVENIRDVKGVIELKGAHPLVHSRVRDWVSSVRQRPILGLSETTMTLGEAAVVAQLTTAVGALAMKKDNEVRFYANRQEFAAAELYARGKRAKAKGV
jgi:hypothetical protein